MWNALLRAIVVFTVAISVTTVLAGCGENKEENVPAVKLTASDIASQADASTHTHIISIPFADISGSPAIDVYQYRSEITNNHSHVIALSKQQMIDLNDGMRVTLTSSIPNTSTPHTHNWNLQGGSMLYDKNCFNCHSNDKRGRSPMNVVFTPSQTGAIISPSTAPVSPLANATAIPDPNYISATETSLDGVYLYGKYCSGCHGPLATSTKLNKTAAQIKLAMGNMGLSDAQIHTIATALVKK
jgi:mono/diheme cytochrome c family protein